MLELRFGSIFQILGGIASCKFTLVIP